MTLILADNRCSVQIVAAQGSAKNRVIGWVAGYFNTPEAKRMAATFTRSCNEMVRSLGNCQAQTVWDGLRSCGTLKVQGAPSPPRRRIRPIERSGAPAITAAACGHGGSASRRQRRKAAVGRRHGGPAAACRYATTAGATPRAASIMSSTA